MTDVLSDKAAGPRKTLTGSSAAADDHSEGMSYLESIPRQLVTLYLPLSIFLIILLFPFYWMALTAIKPNEQLLDMERVSPFWTWSPTFQHIRKLLFESNYPLWLWNTMYVAAAATALSIFASVLAAYAIVRLRFKGAQTIGGLIFLAYLVPPSILFIPLSTVIYNYGLFDSPLALILVYPTILIPFSTWLLMGYFKTIPYELEESARLDGCTTWQAFWKLIFPLLAPMNATVGIFAFLQSWNDFMMPSLITADSTLQTLPVLQNIFQTQFSSNYNVAFASYLMAMAPAIIVYLFTQLWVMAGVTQGAIK